MASETNVGLGKNPLQIKNDLYIVDLPSKNGSMIPSPSILVDLGEMTLIGLGSRIDFPLIVEQIKQILPIEKLKYVIAISLDRHLFSAMTILGEMGAHPTVVADERILRLIKRNAFSWPTMQIDEHCTQLILKSGRILSFIPSPFLITPGAIMIYDSFGKTLFSNYLFETIEKIPPEISKEDYLAPIMAFCRNFVPSTDFLRPVVNRISKLDIELTVTQSGTIFDKETVLHFCLGLSAFEFYNSNVYQSISGTHNQTFNYQSICNQIIQKIHAIFGREAVLETFQTNEFSIDSETLEIISYIEYGPKLWNHLFEVIYVKKGTPWMAVLEPLVDKITNLTGVEIPLIFHSKFAESESKTQQLETEKKQLENRLATTEFHLHETMEKLVKDPLTHYFNEMFLHRHLGERILSSSFPLTKETDLVLFFIQIDNILSINSKYSKKTGDETIRNLGYLLEQQLMKHDLLIKRNGPGFILFVENLDGRIPSLFAQKIQNAVKEAETFIEPVTLSIAIVSLSEFKPPFDISSLSEKMIDLGENRIKATSQGKNMIVDDKTKIIQGKSGRLLVADHEEINLHLLESLFFNENFNVSLAKDGLTALKMAEEIPFDAIIVERTISKLDGMLLKQRINQNPLNEKTPYILLTFNKNAEIISRANLLGIDFVLQKPLIFEEMSGIIQRLVKKGGIR